MAARRGFPATAELQRATAISTASGNANATANATAGTVAATSKWAAACSVMADLQAQQHFNCDAGRHRKRDRNSNGREWHRHYAALLVPQTPIPLLRR